jgi:FtsP/CotA-like multicopper oxidase with cupredoxin domain
LTQWWAGVVAAALVLVSSPGTSLADGDDRVPVPDDAAPTAGLRVLSGPPAALLAAPGESRLVRREDGTFGAVPEIHGRTKIFKLVAREAPWTLRPGLTVLAKTYDGVVPGPTLVVQEGDRVVIDYTNQLDVPDTIHLHGIHGIPPSMDGVPGISQAMVAPRGGHFRYSFVAGKDGTYFYHSHDAEAILNAGLYGGIIVEPAHPRAVERGLAHDDVEIISAWQIDSATENHFTINGKEYPATQQVEVRPGDRVRVRWINISSENSHTMHTHGHDQLVIARDARPVGFEDVEDTVLLGPGQRVDAVIVADAQAGTWLVHCHVLDHVEDMNGMPEGLITAIHYGGTPNILGSMAAAMRPTEMRPTMAMRMPLTVTSKVRSGLSRLGIAIALGSSCVLALLLAVRIVRVLGAARKRRRESPPV